MIINLLNIKYNKSPEYLGLLYLLIYMGIINELYPELYKQSYDFNYR